MTTTYDVINPATEQVVTTVDLHDAPATDARPDNAINASRPATERPLRRSQAP